MKKKVLVGLILLGVLAFGVAFGQPCLAGGCVHEGTSYDDWMRIGDCVIVEYQGESICVTLTDIYCEGSGAALFDVYYDDVIYPTLLSEGDSDMFGNMELHVSNIVCFDGGLVEVQIDLSACALYDTNDTPGIQKDEAVQAMNDYFNGLIDKETATEVMNCYLNP